MGGVRVIKLHLIILLQVELDVVQRCPESKRFTAQEIDFSLCFADALAALVNAGDDLLHCSCEADYRDGFHDHNIYLSA